MNIFSVPKLLFMIAIFKTNVESEYELHKLRKSFNSYIPQVKWDIDLFDCDRILRVDSTQDLNETIVKLFNKLGFNCTVLEVFHAPPM